MKLLARPASLALLAWLVVAPAAPKAAQPPRSPKLVVMIAVDQMRGDYPERYASLFDKGLKRLTTQGAWYRNAAYPYLNTLTCVGHTTIGTGALPFHHGMIQNVWYDRDSAKTVTCTADPKSHDISVSGTSSNTGDSAVNMMVPTLAETMKRQLHARVVTMSLKARSAIGLAGHSGDAVLWFDGGSVETSSAYGALPPAWASDFVAKNPIEKDAGKTWERTLPRDRYQYSDEPPGEKPGGGWSAAFPHPLGAAGDARFFAHWEESPYSDEYLERLAERAIDELKLGQEADHTDFLGISFSAVDVVGHAFGPRSHEIQDTLVRLDATLGRLLDHLNEKVGISNYVLTLSADHGVADVPEQIPNAGRVLVPSVSATIEATLKMTQGNGPFVAANMGNDVYLTPGVYDRIKADPETLLALKHAVEAMPGVSRLLTASDVSSPAARASKDVQLRAAALSYFPGRSGDLIVIPKENWIYGTTTTTHGTWYGYDQHVPVILFGGAIKPGVRREAAMPPDLAVTVASMLGIRLPAADGHVLTAALSKPGRRR